MNENMTTQQAVHIMSEEAVRCERIAEDMAENPLDFDGKAMEHAKHYREKAEAIKVMLKIVRAFNEAGQE